MQLTDCERGKRKQGARGTRVPAALQREAVGAVNGGRYRKTRGEREGDERLRKRSTVAERCKRGVKKI